MFAIETTELTKRYGPHVAIENVSLRVEPGETFGFLGPNGAGKSTTIALLLAFRRPTAGSITVMGTDPQSDPLSVRTAVGVLPERRGLYDRLTAKEHLSFSIESHGDSHPPSVYLDRVGLDPDDDRPVGSYSTGMAQRLRFALALVGDPQVLILDEPFRGLDPGGVARVRDEIIAAREEGVATFVSSHDLETIRDVCDRVAFLIDGRVRAVRPVRDGPPAPELLIQVTDDPHAVARRFRGKSGVRSIDRIGDGGGQTATFAIQCGSEETRESLATTAREIGPVKRIERGEGDLEALFTRLTGGQR